MKRVVLVAALLVALFVIGWENYDLWWNPAPAIELQQSFPFHVVEGASPQTEDVYEHGSISTAAVTTLYVKKGGARK